MDAKLLNEFVESLGGRIIYAPHRRNQLTPERDYIIYKMFVERRTRGFDNWTLGRMVKKELEENNIKSNFTPCEYTIINRFYKIQKAIRDTSEFLKVTT